jgi:hypothetical protein
MDGFGQKVWVVRVENSYYGILSSGILGVYLNEEDAEAAMKDYGEDAWIVSCFLK